LHWLQSGYELATIDETPKPSTTELQN